MALQYTAHTWPTTTAALTIAKADDFIAQEAYGAKLELFVTTMTLLGIVLLNQTVKAGRYLHEVKGNVSRQEMQIHWHLYQLVSWFEVS